MAQMISLDKLKKLAAKPLVEREGSKFFDEFKQSWREEAAGVTASNEGMPPSAVPGIVYGKVKKGFLRDHCPPIEYIAEGSSRAAYALDGGLCLKIATSAAGISQNKAEAKNAAEARGLGIFPEVYEHTDDWAAMLVDCVSPCVDSHECVRAFEEALDVKLLDDEAPGVIGELLAFIVESLPGDLDAILESFSEDYGDPRDWCTIAEAMLSPSNEAQRLLRKLA